MKAALMVVVATLLIGVLAAGQQQGEAPKKQPKIYTNEDLEGRTGGISVIGETAKPDKPTKEKPKAEDSSAAAVTATDGKNKIPDKSQKCADWAWAFVVTSTLTAQGVTYDPTYWIDKTFGGSRCLSSLTGIGGLAASVEGDYTLDDGKKVSIKSAVGAPGGNGVVESLQRGRPFIVVWRGMPYLADTVKGVKVDYGNGNIIYRIEEMTLQSPYLQQSATYSAKKDGYTDLEAVDFTVIPRS